MSEEFEFGEPIEEREGNFHDGFIYGMYKTKNIIDSKQKEIERLKEENNFLKLNNPQMNIEHSRYVKENKRKINNLRLVNKRLNNIINELEKELKEDYKIWMCNSRSNGKSVKFGIDVCKTHFYNRLQELKGSSDNG